MTDSHSGLPSTDVGHALPMPVLVRELAAYAALPLAAGREKAAADVLAAWLPAANELSAKMSEASYQTLVPATVFVHPGVQDGEA